MWQCILDVTDFVANIAQTIIAGFGLWLAWRTFLKEEEQDYSEEKIAIALPEVADLKLFETPKQTTWLKRTPEGIECHVTERRSGKIGGHRWSLSPLQAKAILDTGDIYVNPTYKIRTGLVSIGNHANWLYSKKLFPEPSKLHHQLINLLMSVDV